MNLIKWEPRSSLSSPFSLINPIFIQQPIKTKEIKKSLVKIHSVYNSTATSRIGYLDSSISASVHISHTSSNNHFLFFFFLFFFNQWDAASYTHGTSFFHVYIYIHTHPLFFFFSQQIQKQETLFSITSAQLPRPRCSQFPISSLISHHLSLPATHLKVWHYPLSSLLIHSNCMFPVGSLYTHIWLYAYT